jgi:signal peptidase I
VKRGRFRARLFGVVLIVSVIAAWWFLAPAQIGGSATYVITRGISMEPRFHTGDLALVRPASTYKVGDIVAYRSTLLHVTVLHRIVARHGNLYVFKGDNNNFLDPTYPTRSELIGKLWLRIPQGGRVLTFLHSPGTAAALCGLLGVFFLFGAGERRRRSRRRSGSAKPGRRGAATVSTRDAHTALRLNFGLLMIAAASAGLVFLILGAVAFIRPLTKPTTTTTLYTQRVSFGYTAAAPAGPVYPTGVVKTGDPLFTTLVHRLNIRINYRFTSSASHAVRGSESVVLLLTGPSGWSRTIMLVPRTPFSGDHTSTDVTLDLPHIQSLLGQVARETGMPTVVGATIAVEPRVHINGTVADQPIKTTYDPGLGFQLNPYQLELGGAPSAPGSQPSGGASGGLDPTRESKVQITGSAPDRLGVAGISLGVTALRWIALLGLLLSSLTALAAYLLKRREPFEESVQIQAQYGHLIVPIVGGEDLGWPPVDVRSIKALVRLAESGQRLILHSRATDVDTYMVNDEGTVYRYQVRPSNVVWGEWSDSAAPVKAAA